MGETVLVNLPATWAARLAERARHEGLTVEELVSRLLARSDEEIARLELRRLGEMGSHDPDATVH